MQPQGPPQPPRLRCSRRAPPSPPPLHTTRQVRPLRGSARVLRVRSLGPVRSPARPALIPLGSPPPAPSPPASPPLCPRRWPSRCSTGARPFPTRSSCCARECALQLTSPSSPIARCSGRPVLRAHVRELILTAIVEEIAVAVIHLLVLAGLVVVIVIGAFGLSGDHPLRLRGARGSEREHSSARARAAMRLMQHTLPCAARCSAA